MNNAWSGKSRLLFSIFWTLSGVVLFILGIMGVIDSYWCGMGGGLIGAGSVNLIRAVRYYRDPVYREEVDVQNQDERNRFLYGKAWAWAGYLYVMLNAVAVVVLKLMGHDELSLWAACSVCLIVVLYWFCWLWLRKKY